MPLKLFARLRKREIKFRFKLVWLLVLTAAVALATAFFNRRQRALDAELSRLEGTWTTVVR